MDIEGAACNEARVGGEGAAASFGAEHFDGSAVVEASLGLFEPCAGKIHLCEDADGEVEDADYAGEFVGLVA